MYIGRSPALSKNAPLGGGLGYGQQWTNFTNAERVFGTYYINDTGRAIWVTAAGTSNVGAATYMNLPCYVDPDGQPVATILACYKAIYAGSDGYTVNGGFIVMPGYSYRITCGNGGFQYWTELR